MKFKTSLLLVLASFALGLGLSFSATALPTCPVCYYSCQTKYQQCLASGTGSALCLSRYQTCIRTCPCDREP
ncbi:MAG: hypothetical protein KA144_13735 [Xanthomonadaceae bacterium]|nr:hypothetical protein [Xanthomonadaceae bacterium]